MILRTRLGENSKKTNLHVATNRRTAKNSLGEDVLAAHMLAEARAFLLSYRQKYSLHV